MIRRLIAEAGIRRCSPKIRGARSRRRAADRRLTERAAQLGFASLQAYLVERVIRQGWPLIQVADELEIHTDTVRDGLECCGLRHPTQAAR